MVIFSVEVDNTGTAFDGQLDNLGHTSIDLVDAGRSTVPHPAMKYGARCLKSCHRTIIYGVFKSAPRGPVLVGYSVETRGEIMTAVVPSTIRTLPLFPDSFLCEPRYRRQGSVGLI